MDMQNTMEQKRRTKCSGSSSSQMQAYKVSSNVTTVQPDNSTTSHSTAKSGRDANIQDSHKQTYDGDQQQRPQQVTLMYKQAKKVFNSKAVTLYNYVHI
jgi:hypothetical protein